MYQRRTGSYDEIPDGMKRYINNYGCHFNKKLSDWAASKMYKNVNGKKQYIQPYTKEQVDNLLKQNNIQLERGKLYDHVYLANMVKADFLGSSVPNEQYLAKYIKDVIDDADAEEGFIFNRFYADTIFMNNPIEWEDMV
jgi:hemerythrin superfamily protein